MNDPNLHGEEEEEEEEEEGFILFPRWRGRRRRRRKTAKSPAPGGVQERVFARTLSLKLQEPEYSNHIDTVERYIRKCEVQTYAHSALHVTLYGSVSSGGIVLYTCSIQTVKSQWNHPYLEKGAK